MCQQQCNSKVVVLEDGQGLGEGLGSRRGSKTGHGGEDDADSGRRSYFGVWLCIGRLTKLLCPNYKDNYKLWLC